MKNNVLNFDEFINENEKTDFIEHVISRLGRWFRLETDEWLKLNKKEKMEVIISEFENFIWTDLNSKEDQKIANKHKKEIHRVIFKELETYKSGQSIV